MKIWSLQDTRKPANFMRFAKMLAMMANAVNLKSGPPKEANLGMW